MDETLEAGLSSHLGSGMGRNYGRLGNRHPRPVDPRQARLPDAVARFGPAAIGIDRGRQPHWAAGPVGGQTATLGGVAAGAAGDRPLPRKTPAAAAGTRPTPATPARGTSRSATVCCGRSSREEKQSEEILLAAPRRDRRSACTGCTPPGKPAARTPPSGIRDVSQLDLLSEGEGGGEKGKKGKRKGEKENGERRAGRIGLFGGRCGLHFCFLCGVLLATMTKHNPN